MKLLTRIIMLVCGAFAGQAIAASMAVVVFQGSADSQSRVLRAAGKAAAHAGYQTVTYDASGSIDRYKAILDELIDRHRTDAIVLGMGKPQEASAQYEKAFRRGMALASVASGASPYVMTQIDVDQDALGKTSAIRLFRAMHGSGNVASIRFEKNDGTRLRGQALDDALRKNPQILEIASHTMNDTQDWQTDVARGVAQILDSHATGLRGIWASFDGQAVIADDLLKVSGLDRNSVAIVTVDGSQDIYKRILSPDSSLVATIAIPYEAMAEKAVEQLDGQLKGRLRPALRPNVITFEGQLVDASNAADWITDDQAPR